MSSRTPVLAFLFCLFAIPQSFAQNAVEPRLDRVLHGLRPPVAIKNKPAIRWTLGERLSALHVPGISIAIIDSAKIVWACGFGVKETGNPDSVLTSTLFQAQSISKPVAATAMLRLVESNKLSLDENVNRYLKSWKIPENKFTVQEKITLRLIASHSAGLTVGGFPGYRLGDTIPTFRQILDGEKPANNPPIRVDTLPGSMSRYSGGGFLVMQQILMDVTDETFPVLMKRLVLGPAAMKLSTYEQPLPQIRRKEAASGHDAEGILMKGRWPIHPEMAAAGLWTTPNELAQWVLEIANVFNDRPSKMLSKAMVTQMLTVQKPPFGLGLVLEGTGDAFRFSHSGANLGFRAEFIMYPRIGKGAVVMTNANLGSYLIDEVIQSIAAEFQWPAYSQKERETIAISSQEIDGLIGIYSTPGPFGKPILYQVSREDDQLFGELKGFSPKSNIYPASVDTFFTTSGYTFMFARDSSGRALKVSLGGQIEAIRTQ